jgi:predicted Rossmann fold nucleotide-binding protein DprA/Smf involved in DNA uptake
MKVLIVGSRSIRNYDITEHIPPETELIISGGAEGADSIAEEYADKHKISKLIMRPRYDKYGKAAPLKRNELMVELADEVIALWDGISRGTKYTVEYAKKKNKTVKIVIIDGK